MTLVRETTAADRPVRLRLRGADAVVVQHKGCAMAANYGSVAGELAVCLKRVGLVDRPELELFELRGRAQWLDQLLGAGVGDAVPAAGRASAVAENEIWRVAPDWAMVLGPHATLTRWRRLTGHHLITGATITCVERSSEYSAVLLVGPRAGRVLAAAGLAEELPVGAVASWSVAGDDVLIAREGPDRFQLLLPTQGGAARRALLEAGEPLELGHVGFEALELLTAAQRSSPAPVPA